MKKIKRSALFSAVKITLLMLVIFFLWGCIADNYPGTIIWDGIEFLNTGEFYSRKDIEVVKVGELDQYDIYAEIASLSDKIPLERLNDKPEHDREYLSSIFIKTGKGYLHYFNSEEIIVDKPNIYLYPEKITDIQVSLNFEGEIISSYPKYNNGWKVKAEPNGTLINNEDGREYSYLFWEGSVDHSWTLEEGFVVKGEDTAEFLQEKLSYMGLIPKEYNEFIVYWLPQMEKNKYNLISFVNEDYSKIVELDVLPEPDSLLRVFMVYKKLDKKIDIKEQKLTSFKREGFTVVEWGGVVWTNDKY